MINGESFKKQPVKLYKQHDLSSVKQWRSINHQDIVCDYF